MTKVSSVITGAAGEHFVMAELLRRGLVAAKAPEGVPNFDIVITDISGERLAAIQVKTRRDFKSGDKGWHMKAKHEKLSSDRIFYVLLMLAKMRHHKFRFMFFHLVRLLMSASEVMRIGLRHQVQTEKSEVTLK